MVDFVFERNIFMKKFLKSCILTLIIFALSANMAFAVSPAMDEEQKEVKTAADFSLTMAINEEIMVLNGAAYRLPSPVMAFDKTYVDVYALSYLLGIDVSWVDEADGGYIVASADGKSQSFAYAASWDSLSGTNNFFFVKDGRMYVPLRALADLKGDDIYYNSGVITLGKRIDTDGIYQNVCETNINDYIYTNYPLPASYIVNPYLVYSYEYMLNDASRLAKMYPDLIKTSSIGKSVEGRDLLLIEFGRGDNKIFVCGTHHAREYIATTYLMYAIDRYSYAYRTNSMWGKYNPKAILDNVTFCVVPMVNPDGVNLVQNGLQSTPYASEISNMGIFEGSKYGYRAWKANIRGVDVNWNYDKDWSIDRNKNTRGSAGFNGDYAGSEPETVAVSNYVDSYEFDAYMSFHTQGQIYYWAVSDEYPSDFCKAIGKDTGFAGYRESCTGVGGSFFDYVFRKYKKPTITVELCPYVGNYPYPDSDFGTVWNRAKNVLLVAGNQIMIEQGGN